MRYVWLVLSTSLLGIGVMASAQTKIPSYVNIGTLDNTFTFSPGQGVLLSAPVSSANASLVPTGTVQFFANGLPLGAPVTLASTAYTASQGVAEALATVPIQTTGNYALTSSYSGDSNFAPSTSSYSWPIQVMVNPPGYVATPSPSSLTFKAGATTGNTVLVTLSQVNGCARCILQWSNTIAPVQGTPTPAQLAGLTLTFEPPDSNGNSVYSMAVNSVAPSTITTSKAEHPIGISKRTLLVPAAAALSLLPFLIKRRSPAFLLALAILLFLPCLSGCASVAPARTTTETIPGSSGPYNITVFGTANDESGTGDVTYFTLQIPVTIQ